MKILVSVLFLITAVPNGVMAAPVPDDFASGLRLQIDEAYPMYRLSLPETVYRQATRADLGDIRVFDSAGRQTPHRLIDRRQQKTVLEPQWVAVPHFPVPSKSFEQGNELNIRIQHNGSLLKIEQGGHGSRSTGDLVYLIDLSRLSQSVKKIEVIMDEAATDFSMTVAIDASRDLNRWTTIVARANLLSLNYDGQQLRRTVIELQRARWPYLRLRRLGGNPAITIDKVKASVIGSLVPAVETRRLEVAGEIDPKNQHAVVFDTGGYFPIVKVSVDLSPNRAIKAQLGSRNDPGSDWKIHQTGVFFALQRDQTLVKSTPVSVGRTGHHYWYFSDVSEKQMTGPLPRLELEWEPRELVFLAEGNGPYTLAYGSGRVGPLDKRVASLLKSLSKKKADGMIGEARVMDIVELGGESRRGAVSEPLPWQRILLWAILIGGVVVVATMALRLARQLNVES